MQKYILPATIIYFTLVVLAFPFSGKAQQGQQFKYQFSYQYSDERLREIDKRMEILIQNGVDLNKPVTIALNGTIQELVNFLAENTGLNITIDNQVNHRIVLTFNEALVRDIILYLCDTYQLDFKPTGSIVHLLPYVPPPQTPTPYQPDISFDAASGLLTLKLRRDTLESVARLISEQTGQNIALDPIVQDLKVNGFINALPLEEAMQQLAINNNLELDTTNNYYLIKPAENDPANTPQGPTATANGSTPNSANPSLYVKKIGTDNVSISASNMPILDVVKEVAQALGVDYYLLPEVTQNQASRANASNRRANTNGTPGINNTINASDNLVSIQVKKGTFPEVLTQIFKNSDYTFKASNSFYLIGMRQAEGLRLTKLIQLQYRSARGILDLIPDDMMTNVETDTLYELNSLIFSGSQKNINEIDGFIKTIDKVVPLVMIDLIIVDVQTSKLDEWGVEAGVVPGGKKPGGAIISSSEDNGGFDFTFSPNAINNLLGLLSGRGIINIGQVSPDFFLSLKALQEDGYVDIKSTPKLSTLNSHSAILSIGQKRYYQEQQVNFPGQLNPIPVQANIFKEVEANLDININPIVSGDEQVTLNITFEQSEFVGDPGPNAPPPQVSRRFESMIRIRNGETVVLGGLEREFTSRNKRGLPFISRVPLIGWLFGKHKKNQQKDKLLIFVKPTIVN